MNAAIRTDRLVSGGLFLALLLFAAEIRADIPPSSVPNSSPLPKWKLADGWHVNLWTKDSKGNEAKYDMHIIFSGVHKHKNVDCCRLEFIPIQAPPEVGAGYRVLYEISTGRVKGLLARRDWKEIPLAEVEGTSLPVPLDGFPIEVLPGLPLGETAPTSRSILRVTRDGEAARKNWKATLTNEGKETLLIRQKWEEGSRWWTTYERIRNGEADLICSIAKTPTVPSAQPKTSRSLVDSVSSYQLDPRLQVQLTETFQSPTLPELLSFLERSTGVALRSNSENQKSPVFHSISLNETPAVELMKLIAASKLADGSWEKDGDGYRFASNQPARSDSAGAVKGSGSRNRWAWIAGSATLAILLVSAWILVWRKRIAPHHGPIQTPSKAPSAS